MIKAKTNRALLFLLFVVALIALSGCAKPECKTSADCSPKTCFVSKCESKKCVYNIQRNCCGNRIKDVIENGKPGNQCTCPGDYGGCEGKGKIKIGSRTEDAVYVHYYCNADSKCVLGAEKKDAIPQNFLDIIQTGYFKASSIAKYSKPFDIKKDSFEFAMTLDDSNKDLLLPVRLTKAKILYNSEYSRAELLIAEQDLDITLNGIGDRVVINTPLTLSYRPEQVEETGSIRYSIDYSYNKRILASKTANGTSIYYKEPVRATFTAPSKPIFLFRSE